MDAQHIGADDPDDRATFDAIVARLDLDTTDKAAPADQPAKQPEQVPTAAPRPAPEPAATAPAPENQPSPPTQAPALPQPKKPKPPNYWGANGLSVVYWIAILTGGIGQVTFFGARFGMGLPGYLAAAVIATTFETVMVSSGDTALKFRVEGRSRRQWLPFLVIGFIAAGAASWMNIDHFWSDSTALALLFGGVAGLGFVLHVLDGMVKGSDYIEAKRTYDAEMERQRRKNESRADAQYERMLADHESAQQAAARAVATATSTQTKPATSKPQRNRGQPKAHSKPKLDRDTAVAWSRANGNATQAQVREHFSGQGYEVPAVSTLRGWLNGY